MLSPNHYEKIKVETPEQYIEAVENGDEDAINWVKAHKK